MKKKKLFVSLLLCAMLALSACGKSEDNEKGAEPTQIAESEKVTESAQITEPAQVTESAQAAEPTQGAEQPDSSNVSTEVGIDGNTYFNEIYGFEFTAPAGWMIFDYDTTIQVIYSSYAALYGDVDTMLATLQSAGIDYPFYASSMNVDDSGFVANVLCQTLPASVVSAYGVDGVKTYVDALMQSSVEQYKQLGAECTLTPVETLSIDGHDVYIADSSVRLDGTFAGQEFDNRTIYQRCVAFLSNEYFVNLIVSYYNEEDADCAKEVTDGIVFYD